jgi:sortase A
VNFGKWDTRECRRVAASMLLGAAYFLFAAGITAVSYAAYVVVDAHAYQAKEQSKFENVGASPKETPVSLTEGGVIGEILMPRLELKAIVVQGYSEKLLRRGVGHMPGTALPGEPGNVALAGHRDTFFRALRSIKKGDAITLKTENGDFQYQVESMEVVTANDVDVLKASQGRTLTLITCFPFTYVGPAPKRYVVHAREVESPRELIGR